ncbi:hypothetical protein GF360_03165 [candidate division WWE3 bacterium]|nr:hypothetical protein [candidate division WWE3 bacterium]
MTEEIFLSKSYDREAFLDYLKEFLPDFEKDIRSGKFEHLRVTEDIEFLGSSEELELEVFEITHDKTLEARVALATDGFRVMKQRGVYTALVIYKNSESENWRLSLMTTSLSVKGGRLKEKFSNPRRQSFFLGPDAKINTPYQFLIKKGQIESIEDLKSRFSIEVVNKKFYKEISHKFAELVGAEKGQKALLKLPSTREGSQINLEFAVRLIGRIIFCWFLREKKSNSGKPLMPKDLLSHGAVKNTEDYYHKVLEPIFFEILNKPNNQRIDEFSQEPFSSIPYLNGGLFSAQDDDFYKRSNGDLQSQFHNTLIIPDSWIKELFEILETYNFTIDENTTYDEELSIDPEMLGRIFENLLAEINPETGESARKSTGSYYTPRVIVDYMVDESLFLYLKQQTNIDENKLRAILSFDLTDDSKYPLTIEEKEKIADALESMKLLDPACGSGAFPMGALQKIVFVLQQIDPDGQIWFKKQIKNTSPEIKRLIEQEFKYKNFDYIRKLGVIRKNIYGVDIQPIATEISRLRCFLTLVVDQFVKDEEENRGIKPLPNLDFKFVTANTLIGLPEINKSQQNLFDDFEKIEELKEIRDQYFNAVGIEREKLKTDFAKQQMRILKELRDTHGWTGVAKAELTDKLTDWEPFTHKPTSWFDPEWMFGIKEGFDVVIGNPPYIDSEAMVANEEDLRKKYRELYTTARGNWDIFIPFIEKGTRLLNTKGIISYIIPNKFISSKYSSAARKYLANKKIKEIRDYSELKVFKEADVYPITLIASNVSVTDENYSDFTSMRNLEDIEITNKVKGTLLKKHTTWDLLFFEKDVFKLLMKINDNKKLQDYAFEITGAATVSEAYEIKKIIENSKKRREYKKLVNTGTIDKYKNLWGLKKTQYIKDSYLYPRVKNENIERISQERLRQAKSNKLIVAGMTKVLEVIFDEGECLAGKSTNIILGNTEEELFALLGILNSKLMDFFVSTYFNSRKMSGGYLNISKTLLKNLPIAKIKGTELANKVRNIYSKGISKKTLKEIDREIYDLYKLSRHEIDLIKERVPN